MPCMSGSLATFVPGSFAAGAMPDAIPTPLATGASAPLGTVGGPADDAGAGAAAVMPIGGLAVVVADASLGNRIAGRVSSSPPITAIAAKMTPTCEA